MRLVGEPSVDEILDSIKKVIARDDRAGLAARQAGMASTAMVPPDGDEPEDDDNVLDLAVAGRFLPSEVEPDLPAEAAPLVTAGSRDAMRGSLATLAMMAEPAASPPTLRTGETSLDGLARELLRPALAQWLDQHLPAMVERLVAVEIARIVGKNS